MLYELLTGKHPFVAAISNNLVRKAHTPIRELRPDVPDGLANIIDRALIKHPAGRYNTGLDLSLVFDHVQLSGEDFSSRDNFQIIKDLSFFTAFSEAEIWEVLNASHWPTFKPHQQILTEGEFGVSFHILHRGDCFGEVGFVNRKKRMASIVCLKDVTVMEIRAALIERISMGCQVRFHKAFIDTLAERLLRAMEQSVRVLN